MKRPLIVFVTFLTSSSSAFAHTGIGTTAAFDAGITHPFSGIDHMLAMVAVGLWAGLRGGRALWLWPACFVGAMVGGGVLGIEGVPLPFVEQGILASIVLLGLAVALAASAPLAVGATLIAAAGILHGHAHGAEIPADASGLHYALGFVIATSLLHAAGIAVTMLAVRYGRPVVIRAAGVLTALAGLALAFAGLGA